MQEDCATCGLHYEREPGYFIGAIYVNYAATAAISIGGYFSVDALVHWSITQQVIAWCVFSTLFPLWFFRYSRSLWMTLDHIFNPEPPSLRIVQRPSRSHP